VLRHNPASAGDQAWHVCQRRPHARLHSHTVTLSGMCKNMGSCLHAGAEKRPTHSASHSSCVTSHPGLPTTEPSTVQAVGCQHHSCCTVPVRADGHPVCRVSTHTSRPARQLCSGIASGSRASLHTQHSPLLGLCVPWYLEGHPCQEDM
jgi:hypothetical protein